MIVRCLKNVGTSQNFRTPDKRTYVNLAFFAVVVGIVAHLLSFCTARAVAADSTWVEPSGGMYGTASNWDIGVPGATDDALFGATLATSSSDVEVLFSQSQMANRAEVISGHYDWRFAATDLSYALADAIKVGATPVGGGIGLLLPDSATLTLAPSDPDGFVGSVTTKFLRVGIGGSRAGHLVLDATTMTTLSGPGFANGTVEIKNGAQLLNGTGFNVASISSAGSTATVTIDGIGSLWHDQGGQFWIGHGGNGGDAVIHVQNGGELRSDAVLLLANSSPNGGGTAHITVDGAGSSVRAQKSVLLVGEATIEISDGALFQSVNGFIDIGSNPAGGVATVEIRDSTSHLVAKDLHMAGRGSPGSEGNLNIFGGHAEIERDVFLYSDATITVTGGKLTIGHDDGSNGAVTVGPAGRLFGSPTIHANLVNDGGLVSPGLGVGVLTVELDYLQEDGRLEIEIGGTVQGTEYDFLSVANLATLDGTLDVSLLGGFNPVAGDSFDILTAGAGITNAFTTFNLPSLTSGLAWNVNQGANTLSLAVGLAGDFNGDGVVDSDDLMQWQGDFGVNAGSDADADGDTDGADFLVWQRQFGSGVPTLASSHGIPEPSALALALVMAGSIALRRDRL